ncbi:hypothetical protein F4083_05565, partial [Candidatus Poribacteria bacterium]|nr:hypothetical protein [Candidatus Poribacteria bacterium]
MAPTSNNKPGTWTQVMGPQSVGTTDLFVTSKGTVLAALITGIYRLTDESNGWERTFTEFPTNRYNKMPMAEWGGKLYIALDRDIHASNNEGLTWDFVTYRPEGRTVGFIVTQSGFYLAHRNGIYRSSVGPGLRWNEISSGLEDQEIKTICAIGDTPFVGTDQGLYRLNGTVWQRLNAENIKSVSSVKVSGNSLYVGTSLDDADMESIKNNFKKLSRRPNNMEDGMLSPYNVAWRIYRSDDLGETWNNITPISSNLPAGIPEIELIVFGETILAISVESHRSRDGGKTWTNLGMIKDVRFFYDSTLVAVDEDNFFMGGMYHIKRTTDAGESWQKHMNGIIGTEIRDLAACNNILYAEIAFELVFSTDDGKTWNPVHVDSGRGKSYYTAEFTVVDETLYALAVDGNEYVRICRISDHGDELIPIKDIPPIMGDSFIPKKNKDQANKSQNGSTTDDSFEERMLMNRPRIYGMIVNNNGFYLENNRLLYQWSPEKYEWIDIGLDAGNSRYYFGHNIAILDNTIYVGILDERLLHTDDGGKTWNDITSDLNVDLAITHDIMFIGTDIYVATDSGVLTLDDSENWRLIPDVAGRNITLDFLCEGTDNIYGVSSDGLYRLEKNKQQWKRISQPLPDDVSKILINDNKFYVLT